MKPMRLRTLLITACAVTTMFTVSGKAQEERTGPGALTVTSVTLTIEGTSKRASFFASTRTVRLTNLQLGGPPTGDVLQQVLQPGGLAAVDVAVPVMSLTSPDKGVDERLHESLQAAKHPEIRFRLRSVSSDLSHGTGPVLLRAHGTLTITGVDRDLVLTIKAMRTGSWLVVDGTTDLLMTDFGIQPPQGLLRMLQTDPAVRVRFYLTLKAAEAR
jgi:hypothetical protein